MGTRSAHERWCSRNEPLHHHRGCECTVASPAETAERCPLKKERLVGSKTHCPAICPVVPHFLVRSGCRCRSWLGTIVVRFDVMGRDHRETQLSVRKAGSFLFVGLKKEAH